MVNRVVIALGGNALGKSPFEQKEKVRQTVETICDFISDDMEVVISHGNGPQVGMISLAFEKSSKIENSVYEMELDDCCAMSAGYIGYHLQNALKNEFNNRHINRNVVSLLTQVVVNEYDKAFDNPTKPVGSFYTEEKAKEMIAKGICMKEDSGRGYRKMVPSPQPMDIIEKDVILSLIKDKNIVIACGGGGIPVIKTKSGFKGISGVIDKDLTSSMLAELIDAKKLIILTAVPKVFLGFQTENERTVDVFSVDDLKKHIENKEFKEGSMLPKITACSRFVKSKKGREAIITSIDDLKESFYGMGGTKIIQI